MRIMNNNTNFKTINNYHSNSISHSLSQSKIISTNKQIFHGIPLAQTQ